LSVGGGGGQAGEAEGKKKFFHIWHFCRLNWVNETFW
jgi:hypothetical protein